MFFVKIKQKMTILFTYSIASCLFTFVREGTMHPEFNSVILFTVLYSRFKHCAKDVSKVTAQHTILEYSIKCIFYSFINSKNK